MTKAMRILVAMLVLAVTALPPRAGAQLCSSPRTVLQWVNLGPGSWGTTLASSSAVCFSPRAVVDGTGATHVYSVDNNSHLLEFFQSALGSGWATIDITAQTGIAVQGPPNPMFFGGSDIQVYAVSSSHLISFITSANNHVYQAFNLTNLANGPVVLNSMPMPILFGTTVHIYIPNTSFGFEDYVKTTAGQWQAVNLSTPTGVSSSGGAPVAYGGNSIQIAADPSFGGDLRDFIELVNPDGSLTGSFSVFDLSSLAHGTGVNSGLASQLVLGPSHADVAIYIADRNGELVEYFKVPTSQWVERSLAALGSNVLTPSVLYFPSSGPNGTVRIFTNVINSAGNGFLFEYDGDPVVGSLAGGPALAGEGPMSGNPHAVLNNGTVEVFTLN